MSEYTLTLNQKQASILQDALEVYARLGIGQWRDAVENLPLKSEMDWSAWNDTLDQIKKILSPHMTNGIDGYQSSLSIGGDDTKDVYQTAWDLYQVVRHRLSWDRAIERGDVASADAPRNWSTMISVFYDEPMRVGPEPLANIEKAPASTGETAGAG